MMIIIKKIACLSTRTRGYLLDMTLKEALVEKICDMYDYDQRDRCEDIIHPNECGGKLLDKYPLPSTESVEQKEKMYLQVYEKTPLRCIMYLYLSHVEQTPEDKEICEGAMKKMMEMWENVIARRWVI